MINLPTDYKPRKGDVLLIRGTVKYDGELIGSCAHVTVAHYSMFVGQELIAGIESRRFKIGDILERPSSGGILVEVLAMHGDHIWTKETVDGGLHTFTATDLIDAKVVGNSEEE